MENKFETAMTVVRFGAEDVIATSSLTVRGFDAGSNNIAGDGQITFRGITYTVGTQSGDLYSALSGYGGANTKIVKSGNTKHNISDVINNENDSSKTFSGSWNGSFVWNSSKGAFYINKQ